MISTLLVVTFYEQRKNRPQKKVRFKRNNRTHYTHITLVLSLSLRVVSKRKFSGREIKNIRAFCLCVCFWCSTIGSLNCVRDIVGSHGFGPSPSAVIRHRYSQHFSFFFMLLDNETFSAGAEISSRTNQRTHLKCSEYR